MPNPYRKLGTGGGRSWPTSKTARALFERKPRAPGSSDWGLYVGRGADLKHLRVGIKSITMLWNTGIFEVDFVAAP